jgi:hypothetical protein
MTVQEGLVMRAERQTVDLTAYPDLVVIYLGMRVRRPRGLLRLFGLGPQIQKSWKAQPDGLLLHEDLVWSLVPVHLGMRQYWRDLDSLERWTRSESCVHQSGVPTGPVTGVA